MRPHEAFVAGSKAAKGLGDHLGNPKTISTRLGERAFARLAYIHGL
jgi:hypothetical protein